MASISSNLFRRCSLPMMLSHCSGAASVILKLWLKCILIGSLSPSWALSVRAASSAHFLLLNINTAACVGHAFYVYRIVILSRSRIVPAFVICVRCRPLYPWQSSSSLDRYPWPALWQLYSQVSTVFKQATSLQSITGGRPSPLE